MNSIISLILIVPLENNEGLVTALCEKLSKTQANDKKNMARLRLLTNLFHGLDDRSAHRCIVYTSLLRMAGTADLMHHVNPSLDMVNQIYLNTTFFLYLKMCAYDQNIHQLVWQTGIPPINPCKAGIPGPGYPGH